MTEAPSGAGDRPSRRHKGRRRRIARNAGLALLALVLLLAGFLGWLVGTPSGLRFAVEQGEQWLPQTVAFETAEGRLAGPLTLTGVRVRTDAARVGIERLELRWSPLDLLHGTLRVDRLAVSGVDVALAPGGEAEEPAGPASLPDNLELPLAIVLDAVAVDNVRLTTATGTVQRIDRLRLRARAGPEAVRVERLRVTAPEGRVAAHLRVAAARPHDLAGEVEWRWSAADDALPPLAGRAELDGSLADLHVVHRLTAPTAATVDARLQAFGETPRWQAELALPPTRPRDWLEAAPALTASADLRLSGTFERATVAGSFELGDVPAGPVRGRVDLTADAERVRIAELVLEPAAPGDARTRVAGEIGLAGEAPRFDLQGEWQALRWPFDAPASVVAPQGRLALSGTADDYRFEGEARVAPGPAAGLPATDDAPAEVTFSGAGSTNALSTLAVQADWRGAALEADGRVRWQPTGEGRLALDLRDVRPEHFVDAVNGRFDARLAIDADWDETGVRADLALERLSGELNGQPLDGTARVRYGEGAVAVPQLRVTAGDARLQASGRIGDRLALDWSLEIPNLNDLVEAGSGRFSGSGRIGGTVESPVLEADASGRDLRWRDIRLARLALSARATGEDDRARIGLDLQRLTVDGTTLDSAQLGLTGTPADHRLVVEATGDPGALELVVTGSAEGADWRGRLRRARLVPRDRPAWELAEPAPLAWTDGRATLEGACWRQASARACLSGGGTPADWRARLNATGIDLAMLGAYGPSELAYEGALELQVELAGGDGPVTGGARLDLTAGQVSGPVDDGREILLDWEPGHAEATLGAERIDARLRLPLTDGGRLAATIGLGREQPGDLAGRIQARIDDLGLAAAMTPAIGAVDGSLVADVALGGTLAEPRLSGSVELLEGRVGVAPLGIELRDLGVELETAGRGFALDARARSDEGRLRARLELRPGSDGAWEGEGSIRGEGFTAVALPEARITVSPELRWRIEQRTVRIEGAVAIPAARLEPRDLSGAVQPSSDVVVVGADGEPPAEGEGWRVFADVDVTLGDEVHLAAFGLSGRLEGDIELRERPGQLTSASGELRVVDGSYTVYRQTLEIERGRVLFDGGPVGDPGLDVRAVRRPRDVLVGVHVRGTLREPRVSLFSEPPMPESQQLSYLIAGIPLRETSGEEEDAVTAAAAALASSRQGAALADRLGIDELGVEREQGEGASLVLGRYLSPRLYVGYGIGLAEQANSVRLRYELTDQWSLEARSGNTAGADLLYSIESD